LTTLFAIGNIVVTVNNSDLKQISKLMDDKFDEKLAPIQKTLSEHGKLLKSHGKMLRALKKDQNTMLGMLDDEQMKQRKRIKRVEDHLGLTSPIS
jgi:hypothetical protein